MPPRETKQWQKWRGGGKWKFLWWWMRSEERLGKLAEGEKLTGRRWLLMSEKQLSFKDKIFYEHRLRLLLLSLIQHGMAAVYQDPKIILPV